jgi:hypothetical protein
MKTTTTQVKVLGKMARGETLTAKEWHSAVCLEAQGLISWVALPEGTVRGPGHVIITDAGRAVQP